MPQRYRMTYAVVLDGPDMAEPRYAGPFGDLGDARHFAEEFCRTSDRVTICQVQALIPPIFICDEALDDARDGKAG